MSKKSNAGMWVWAAILAAVGVYWYEEHKAVAAPGTSPAGASPLTFLTTTTAAGTALARDLFQNGCASVTLPVTTAAFQNAYASDPAGNVSQTITGTYDTATAAALSLVIDGRGLFATPVPGACV
jgi:hypothetical protein